MEKSMGLFFYVPTITICNLCESLKQDIILHKASKVVDVFEFYMYSLLYRYFRIWHVVISLRVLQPTTRCGECGLPFISPQSFILRKT